MSAPGRSLQGRPSGKSDHVGYAPKSGSSFRALAGSRSAIETESQRPDLLQPVSVSRAQKFDVNPWWGILAPVGLSDAIARKISADVNEILKTPDMVDVLARQGATVDQFAGSLPRPS